MVSDELRDQRERFRDLVAAWVSAMNNGTERPGEADRITAKTDATVETWTAAGTAEAVLEPLLTDESAHVRCAAAAYLLRQGTADRASEVLEAIAADDELGLAASTADTVLLVWERERRGP